MKSITSRLALILAAVVLFGMAALLATSQPQYCGPVDRPKPIAATSASAPTHAPTLAPPQNVVVVRVESDKPDIEVGWVEN
jgi:hypothetical protein